MAVIPAAPTFSPHTHAKLSPRTYLTAHLNSSPPTRPSGRSPDQSRSISAHTSSLTHCHGSAVLRQGDTAVVCGIRGEILKAEDAQEQATEEDIESTDLTPAQRRRQEQEKIAQLGILVPNIELATGCSPDHLPGGPPSTVAQTLSQRLLSSLIHNALVSLDSLEILASDSVDKEADDMDSASSDSDSSGGVAVTSTARASGNESKEKEVKGFWTLYIDVCFISLDHGSHSAFNAAYVAVLLALRDVKLPHAYFSVEDDCSLCDAEPSKRRSLQLRKELPVPTSFGVFVSSDEEDNHEDGKRRKQTYILSDPDAFEENLCEEVLTITVAEKGQITRIEKSGGGHIDAELMKRCLKKAHVDRLEVLKILEDIT